MVGTGLTKILVAMGLPVSCIDSVSLKRDCQFNDVDDWTVPDDDVRSEVSAGSGFEKGPTSCKKTILH